LYINGLKIFTFSRSNDYIKFELRYSSQDIGCGMVYSLIDGNEPDVQFLVDIQPLSVSNWYYYITDYNAWRNSQEK
jgi:hypothetical protein